MSTSIYVTRFDKSGRDIESADLSVSRVEHESGKTTNDRVFLNLTHSKTATPKNYVLTVRDFAKLVHEVFPDASFTLGTTDVKDHER
jgi:hypothetical protein